MTTSSEKTTHAFDIDDLPRGMDDLEYRVQYLARSNARSEIESTKAKAFHYMRMVFLIGVVCTFGFAFYRVSAMQRDVDALTQRINERYASLMVDRVDQGIDDLEQIAQRWKLAEAKLHHVKDKKRNSSEPHKERSRRSAPRTTDAPNGVADSNQWQTTVYGDHFSRHLVPYDDNITTIRKANWFMWKDNDHESNAALDEPGFELYYDRFIQAPVSGFYFLYCQITYGDRITRTVGHQIVKKERCGTGSGSILMETALKQANNDPRVNNTVEVVPSDSAYTGGVAYLLAGDFIAVRPKLGITKVVNVAPDDKNTYFGGFLISRDNQAPPMEEICD